MFSSCVALIDDDVWTEVRRMIREDFGDRALDQVGVTTNELFHWGGGTCRTSLAFCPADPTC